MEITEAGVDGWLKAHGYIKTKIAKKVTEHPVFVYVMRAGVAIEKNLSIASD